MQFGVKHLESGRLARWRTLAPALALMAFAAASAMAQADAGTVHGHVRAAGGGVLVDASVTAKNSATGVAVTKMSGSDGVYSIGGLPPGHYDVSAALCSDNAVVTKSVELKAGASVTQDFELACPGTAPKDGPTMDIYGFAMLDMGYQTGVNHPDWFDVIRPTKLPSFDGEFGKDGHTYASVRQSRLGVKANIPTDAGTIKTIFEFELFGTGVDAGQTTFRLRHAWGEFNGLGAGQTWSPFMDPNVFPNSVEYWGPSGMVFFRNVQIRWQPIENDNMTFNIALERPGASADGGNYADRIEIQNLKGRFPYPDISSSVKWGGDWGYVRAAGILRYMKWDDTLQDQFELSGHATGWGINLSSNLNLGPGVLRLQAMYGEGVENYMNDAPVDIGAKKNFGNPKTPIKGELLPVTGLVAFYDINWSDKWTSTVGYSSIDISNSNGQAANAFSKGQYALANILYYPTKGVMFGPELQWGNRKNFIDHFSSEDFRIQFSFKYNFGHTLMGGH